MLAGFTVLVCFVVVKLGSVLQWLKIRHAGAPLDHADDAGDSFDHANDAGAPFDHSNDAGPNDPGIHVETQLNELTMGTAFIVSLLLLCGPPCTPP